MYGLTKAREAPCKICTRKLPTHTMIPCIACQGDVCRDESCRAFSRRIRYSRKNVWTTEEVIICKTCKEDLKLESDERSQSFILERLGVTKDAGKDDDEDDAGCDADLFGARDNKCDLCNGDEWSSLIEKCIFCHLNVCITCRRHVTDYQSGIYFCKECGTKIPVWIKSNMMTDFVESYRKYGADVFKRLKDIAETCEYGIVVSKEPTGPYWFEVFKNEHEFKKFCHELWLQNEGWRVGYIWSRKKGRKVYIGKVLLGSKDWKKENEQKS